MKCVYGHGKTPVTLTGKKCKCQNDECSMCLSMLKNKNHIRTAVCVCMCVNAHTKKAVKIYRKCSR